MLNRKQYRVNQDLANLFFNGAERTQVSLCGVLQSVAATQLAVVVGKQNWVIGMNERGQENLSYRH